MINRNKNENVLMDFKNAGTDLWIIVISKNEIVNLLKNILF